MDRCEPRSSNTAGLWRANSFRLADTSYSTLALRHSQPMHNNNNNTNNKSNHTDTIKGNTLTHSGHRNTQLQHTSHTRGRTHKKSKRSTHCT